MTIPAFLILLACQLAGNLLRQALALPVPGPVIGMSILTVVLVFRAGKTTSKSPTVDGLEHTAETLVRNMGLLFVPAGVGIITEIGALRLQWLPIAAGLIGSTLLSLAVTGWVMHFSIRRRAANRSAVVLQASERS
ncbi:CidA/LrgA family protein [Bradyrhizobium sp. th.b2]|uniref:CidA/LrgA family protein n=1 Tax=Bradyrhizobium sp. th-b2 TaxID=172088 RepID=UPI000409ACBB|nr:CidA/LrgA family protein [Bradyrhizobium sp. th.b2]